MKLRILSTKTNERITFFYSKREYSYDCECTFDSVVYCVAFKALIDVKFLI